MKTIGWIGLGAMGLPMAQNVLKAGYELVVYNRSKDKERALLDLGARTAASPKELALNCDVVVIMVTNGQATKEILLGETGVLEGAKPGQIIVNMSTIGIDDTKFCADEVTKANCTYIDAPVSGSVGPAINKQLLILTGGKKEKVDELQPLFEGLGRKTLYFGDCGSGAAAKLVINQLLALTMQSISESLVFGEALGLGKEQILEMIENSGVNTPILQGKKQLLISEEFPSACALELMLKDLNLIVDEMQQHHIPLPLTSTSQSVYTAAKANGKGKEDFSSVYEQLKQNAGLNSK